MKRSLTILLKTGISFIIFLIFFTIFLYIFSKFDKKEVENFNISRIKAMISPAINKYSNVRMMTEIQPTIIEQTPTPTLTPSVTPIPYTPTPTLIWGKASQVSEHSWTMNIQNDDRMATPKEILDALNSYRNRHSRSTLSLDDNLTKFAQSRADTFQNLGKTDEHAGFNDFLKDDNNFKQLGFSKLGENSSSGYQLYGVHLIEWIYAGDKPHDDNQLDSEWSHVGIGVNGTMTDLVFGGHKI